MKIRKFHTIHLRLLASLFHSGGHATFGGLDAKSMPGATSAVLVDLFDLFPVAPSIA